MAHTLELQRENIKCQKENDKIYLNNTNLKEFNSIWYNYFDLGTDYTEIKNKLKNMDEYLNKATEFGWE